MCKKDFLAQLRKGLSGLPREDMEERMAFYSEMIDDRMDEGHTEETAVAAVGAVDEIISQILADISITKLVNKNIQPKRHVKAWEIALLILGCPLWLPLLIAVFSAALSLYISLWAVIILLWAVFGSVAGCAFGSIAGGMGLAFGGSCLVGIAIIGAGMVCTGLAIFVFYGCKAATKGALSLTKKLVLWIKNRFKKKEEA